MNHELRIKLLEGFLLLALFFTLSSPVYAASPSPCVDSVEFGKCPAGLQEIEDTVGNIISVVVGLGFIAMLVMLVIAGFKYLTSAGEPKAIQAAHQAFTWAILGILFMIVAWVVLQLIEAVTGVHVTTFDIKALCSDGTDLMKFCRK